MTEPITLAFARMKTMSWVIYRVRRLYYAPANAIRSVEGVLLGGHRTVHTALTEVSRLVDIAVTKNEEIAERRSATVIKIPTAGCGSAEAATGSIRPRRKFYTVAPAQAQDKELDSFANAWADHTDEALVLLERRVDTPSLSCGKSSSTAKAAAALC